jgi:hypothetical protein
MTNTPVTGEVWGDEVERGRAFMLEQATKPLSELLIAVERSRDDLVAALSGVSDAQARFKPHGGSGSDDEEAYSLTEVARHIVNVEPVMINRVLALATGEPPPAGQGPGALGGNEDTPLARLVEMIQGNRAPCAAAISEIEGKERLDTTMAHRVFGELNCRGFLCLHGLHLADHARQAAKVKTHPDFPGS